MTFIQGSTLNFTDEPNQLQLVQIGQEELVPSIKAGLISIYQTKQELRAGRTPDWLANFINRYNLSETNVHFMLNTFKSYDPIYATQIHNRIY